MNLTPTLQYLIEQYLDNQLSGQALVDFEEKLSMDKALAQEVAFQKDLHLLLADSPENELRKNLELLSAQVVLPKKKEDNRGIWWWLPNVGEVNGFDWLFGQPQRHLVWLLPLLLLAGWWITSNSNPIEPKDQLVGTDSLKNEPFGEPLEINPIVAEEPEAINKDSEDTLAPSRIVKQTPKPKQVSPKSEIPELVDAPEIIPDVGETYSSIPPTTKKEYEISTPPPIYWYDGTVEPILDSFNLGIYFGEQPNLEALIAQNAKDKTIQVEVLQKPEIAYLSTDTAIGILAANDLSLQLKLQTKAPLLDRELVLYMKDNRGNPYGPFSLADAVQTVDDSTYLLTTNLKLWDKTPRLAYYSITDYQTQADYFTEKLAIVPEDSLLNKFLFPVKGDYQFIELADLVYYEGEEPDFFTPNAKYETLIAETKALQEIKVTFSPVFPDTIYGAQKNEQFTSTITLQTKDDLMSDNVWISVVDNQGDNVHISNSYIQDSLKKRFGTDSYLFPFEYGSPNKDGLYYFSISGYVRKEQKNYYTNKFIYITDNE